jgi:hypothetical protein
MILRSGSKLVEKESAYQEARQDHETCYTGYGANDTF